MIASRDPNVSIWAFFLRFLARWAVAGIEPGDGGSGAIQYDAIQYDLNRCDQHDSVQ
jgi:hypothetical protein